MSHQYNTKFLTLGGILALLLSLLLFGVLILSALYNQYREMQISIHSHTGKNIADSISRITRLGIEPDRIGDLENKIQYFTTDAIENCQILVQDNQTKNILASLNHMSSDSLTIPEKLKTEHTGIKSFVNNDTLWLIFPIYDRKENTVANIFLGVDNKDFTEHVKELLSEQIKIFLASGLFACFLLVFLCMLTTRHVNRKKIDTLGRNENYLVFSSLLFPLLLAQALTCFSVKEPLENIQQQNFEIATRSISSHIIQDIDHIQDLGISVGEIRQSFAEYMHKIQQQFTWLNGIECIENNIHYYIKDGKIISSAEWQKEINDNDIITTYVSDRQNHSLSFLCSSDTIQENLFSLLLDTLTITLISFVFMVEMLNFLLLKEEQRHLIPPVALSSNPKFMRTIIFLCIFGTSMPISFLPMRMAEISSDLFGLPKNIVMSLPLSCETMITGVALFFGGLLAEKKGWRPLMLWGSLLVTLGSIGSGLSTDALAYIISRCVSGYGYGYIYLMSQVFVIAKSAPENRTANISAMLAGLYAGLLCGSAFGGLIADRFGYAFVFFVISCIIGILGICIFVFIPKENITVAIKNQEKEKSKIDFKDLLDFFANPKMAGLLLLHIVPCAFVTTCLFQFYVPISLDEAGVSPAGIGRVTMIFCLVIVYIGPYLGIVIDRSKNKAIWIFYADLIGIVAIMFLAWMNGLWASIWAVFLLGICNTIVYSVQGIYALELPAAKKFGEAKSVTVYNVAERIGQVLGPITLGITISIYGGIQSLYGMAAAFLVMCIAFIAIALKK